MNNSLENSIILHEISQELQTSVFLEKWFPNFFHTLVNYRIQINDNVDEPLFPYANITKDIITTVLDKINYESEFIDEDVDYALQLIQSYPIEIYEELKDKSLDDILYQKDINNLTYYYFDVDNMKLNQLRIHETFIEKIKTKFPSNSEEEIIGLILRFSMISSYSWCLKSISNATTLMLPRSLHAFVRSLSDNYLECFSSVINANTSRYCSIFKSDIVFEGCVGPFSLQTLQKVKPKLLFANPPYDNGTVENMVKILIDYHSHHDALSIITLNRKDGGLYDMINDKYDNEIYPGLLDLLSQKHESKLLDIIIIPNYLMSYELIDNHEMKILGIKRDTMFIFYGTNLTNYTIQELKVKMFQLIKDFRLKHTKKKKKIKYNNRSCNYTQKLNNVEVLIERYKLSKKFNFKKSIIDNYKLLSKIFN